MEWEAEEWKAVYVKKQRPELRKAIKKKQNGGHPHRRCAIALQENHKKTEVESYF